MADSIQIHGHEFVPFLSEEEITGLVDTVAERISMDYSGGSPLFVVVLNGAFMFASDLIRRVVGPCEVGFLRVSSYSGTGSTGIVHEKMALGVDITGRDVVLVEDIVDTGRTIGKLRKKMLDDGASTVTICSMLFKPDAFRGDHVPEYVGIEIPDRFVVGYGLDHDGLGRNLPSIYQIKPKD